MATNKHAQIRYLALDRCFSNFGRTYNYDDLIVECNNAIYNHTGIQESVKKRQVQYDIKFMESEDGFSIDLKRIIIDRKVYLRYKDRVFSIKSSPINQTEANQLKEALLTLNRIKGLPQFDWADEMVAKLESSFNANLSDSTVIGFDEMPYLKGVNFISELYNKIVFKRVLKICYKPFNYKTAITKIIHPYYLKQYNNRWFLFGFNSQDGYLNNLALDRIISFEEVDENYKKCEIDFDEYFEDVIGVTIPMNKFPEKIKLIVSNELLPYIESKPIHGSQKIVSRGGDGVILEIEVYINYELTSLLLSYGDKLHVSEPLGLREDIKTIFEKGLIKYS